MSDQDNTNVTPIQPAAPVKQISTVPSKLPEEDRLRLVEPWLEMIALQNGIAALQAQLGQYAAQTAMAQSQMQTMQARGVDLQRQFNELFAEVKQRLGIPQTWDVDPKTGNVAPPQPKQPVPPR